MLGSDCTLVGGDSGGPLFDLDGKVIGIHSSIGGGLRENRHVPMDTYTDDWEDLLGGKLWGSQAEMMGGVNPERPAIGVRLREESTQVAGVNRPSPAARAGIEVGDVIRKVGKRKVDDFDELKAALEKLQVGQTVKFEVERGDETLNLDMKLERLGKFLGQRRSPEGDPEEEEVRARGSLGVFLLAAVDRAEVKELLPGAAAAKAGVKVGDVILKVDGEPVAGPIELAENIGARSPGDTVSLLLLRGEKERELEVTLDKATPIQE